MPRSEDDASLTKDYTNSPLHRYKAGAFHSFLVDCRLCSSIQQVAGSKNYQHITEPCETLHLSNLAEPVTEEVVRELFSRHGTVVNFKFFAKDKRMALIQMATLDEAMDSLIHLHNHELMGQNIRVSFSKQPITNMD